MSEKLLLTLLIELIFNEYARCLVEKEPVANGGKLIDVMVRAAS